MKFSARSQYALEAMLALVETGNGLPIQVRQIAQDNGIPVRFLEQIMASLKKAGLVKSIRGARGGYLLDNPPSAIPVAEILQAVEGPIEEAPTITVPVPPVTQVVHELWGEAQDAVHTLFHTITLEELSRRCDTAESRRTLMYHI